MRIAGDEPDPQGERANLMLATGDAVACVLLSIDCEARRLTFRPAHANAVTLPFSEIRCLQLQKPVELEQIPLAVPPGAVALKSGHRAWRCTVHMKDGTDIEAEALAVLMRPCGLYVFVVHPSDGAMRWFFPSDAFNDYTIDPLEENAPDEHRADTPTATAPHAAAASEPDVTHLTHVTDVTDVPSMMDVPDAPASAPPAGPSAPMQEAEPRPGPPSNRRELEHFLEIGRSTARGRIGELLVAMGLVNEAQVKEALSRQRWEGGPHRLLGEVLVDMGAIPREALSQAVASQLGVPTLNLMRFACDPNAIRALPEQLAWRHWVMPLYIAGRRLVVAIEDPFDWKALHEVEFATGLQVDPVMASHDDLASTIAKYYGGIGGAEAIGQLVARLGEERPEPEVPPEAAQVTESDNTLVRLVNKMIVDAFDAGASDIHIETGMAERPTRVRFRVDGVLRPYIEVPANFRPALVSRIKIMCSLDISEHRRPQDGKIRFQEQGIRPIELRVVVMPTAQGLEDVVMRILAAPRALSLDQLGLAPRDLAQLKAIAERSYGLLFVCGPTGSGKTTTLHSLLAYMNTGERKIWTVEDPVEIAQEGLCQVQVNPKLDLTFPNVLRSFLRADPDVIMVGETRDPETARTVIAASLTGHVVLSTMHTNSAAESIVRLLDFGLDPFNFADALLGVLGQRLVRRLCQCKKPHVATPEEVAELAREYCGATPLVPAEVEARWRSRYGQADGTLTLHAPAGCEECDHTGYKGRLGVYEMMVASPSLKEAVLARESSTQILARAVSEGMVTLMQDGIEKVLQGHLDLRQVAVACS